MEKEKIRGVIDGFTLSMNNNHLPAGLFQDGKQIDYPQNHPGIITANIQYLRNHISSLTNVSDEEIEEVLREKYNLGVNQSIKEEQARIGLCKSYEDIINIFGKWIDISEEHKKILAVWIIGTYFHKSFSTYPFIFLNAMRGSGKTRTLKLISALQCNGNGEVLTNPSESVIFRTASQRGLIIDEMDSEKSKEKAVMRECLNAAYKKGGKVFRMEKQKVEGKEQYLPKGHDLFTPVALANIEGIEDVLADRSISLTLDKSMDSSKVKKIEDFDTNPEIQQIKANLSQFSVELCSVYLLKKATSDWNNYVDIKYTPLHTIPTIHNYTITTPQELSEEEMEMYNKIDNTGIFGRNLELFFPLILTGKVLSSNIFEEIITLVSSLNILKKDDEFTESKDVSLIEFVSTCERYRFEYKFVSELHTEFKEFIGTSPTTPDDIWNTITWFGAALKRLKLLKNRKRVAKGVIVFLEVDKAKEKLKMFKGKEE